MVGILSLAESVNILRLSNMAPNSPEKNIKHTVFSSKIQKGMVFCAIKRHV